MSVDEVQRFAATLRALARSKNSAAVLSSIKSYRQKAAKPTEYFFVEVQDKLAFEGDFRSALAVVDDGLTVYPTSYRLYEARGNIFLSTFELEAARRDLDKALSLAPNNPSVQYHMALLRTLEHVCIVNRRHRITVRRVSRRPERQPVVHQRLA